MTDEPLLMKIFDEKGRVVLEGYVKDTAISEPKEEYYNWSNRHYYPCKGICCDCHLRDGILRRKRYKFDAEFTESPVTRSLFTVHKYQDA